MGVKKAEDGLLTLRCQRSGARRVGVDVEDFACCTVGIQVCDCGGSGAALVQEDESNVIRLLFVSAIKHEFRDRALMFVSLESLIPWKD